MTRPHLALLDPNAGDDDVDAFLGALGVTPAGPQQRDGAAHDWVLELVALERGGVQDWTKGKGGLFSGSRPGGPKGLARTADELVRTARQAEPAVTADLLAIGAEACP